MFQSRFPSKLDLGLVSFDLTEIRKVLRETLSGYVSELKAELLSYFHSLLSAEEGSAASILELLRKSPSNLTQYIELSHYLSCPGFRSSKEKLESNTRKLRNLFQVLEDCHILCSPDDLSSYFGSFSWLSKLAEAEGELKALLQDRKNKFRSIVSAENQRVFEDFKARKAEIAVLVLKADLENVYQNASQSKAIMQELGSLYERAYKSNENEDYLGYEKTDFSGTFSLGACLPLGC